jgi:hypothetical protein
MAEEIDEEDGDEEEGGGAVLPVLQGVIPGSPGCNESGDEDEAAYSVLVEKWNQVRLLGRFCRIGPCITSFYGKI